MTEHDHLDLTPEEIALWEKTKHSGGVVRLDLVTPVEQETAERLKQKGLLLPGLSKRVEGEFVPSQTLFMRFDENPALVFLSGLHSEHSKRNMHRYLDQIASLLSDGRFDALDFNWSALRFQHVQAVRSRLTEVYAPATVNGMLSALRGVLKTAWRLEQMTSEDYQRAIDVQNVKGETLPAGRSLSEGEILALVNACLKDDSPAGIRDAAIIGILYTCGIRRAELVKLTIDHYNRNTGQIRVISGKGQKDRTVYVTNGAQDALHDWLNERGDMAGPLFTPINKGGHIHYDQNGSPSVMTSQAIYNMLKKRANEAAVKDFSPHDFRRTFVGDLLDRGVDIVTVQKLAGHASVTTTGRYDRRPERVKAEAASKVHFPYQRRGKQK